MPLKKEGLEKRLKNEANIPELEEILPKHSRIITETFDYVGMALIYGSGFAYMIYQSRIVPKTTDQIIRIATDLYNSFSSFIS